MVLRVDGGYCFDYTCVSHECPRSSGTRGRLRQRSSTRLRLCCMCLLCVCISTDLHACIYIILMMTCIAHCIGHSRPCIRNGDMCCGVDGHILRGEEACDRGLHKQVQSQASVGPHTMAMQRLWPLRAYRWIIDDIENELCKFTLQPGEKAPIGR